jgi:hypothetical protein
MSAGLSAANVAAVATVAAIHMAPATPAVASPLQPTNLAFDLLKLLPEQGEASHAFTLTGLPESDLDYDPAARAASEERFGAALEAVDAAVDAILDRAASAVSPMQHLADLAVAHRVLDIEGGDPGERLIAVKEALIGGILQLASIPEKACCQQAMYERAKTRAETTAVAL